MEIINNTMGRVDIFMEKIFSNKYYSSIITLVLILYTGIIAPKLPNSILKLFDNSIFRILVLSLVLYYGNKNTKLAISIAVGFIVSMNLLAKRKMFENFSALQPDLDNNDPNLESTDSNMTPPGPNELDGNSNLENTSNQPPTDMPTTSEPPSTTQSPQNNIGMNTESSEQINQMEDSNSEAENQNSSEQLTREKDAGEECKISGNKNNCLKGLHCDPTSRKCRKKTQNESCTIFENDSDDCDDVLYCDKKTKVCKPI